MQVVFLWYSRSLHGALVFVIHSVNVLDAALAFTAQRSLYGEESELHQYAGSLTVMLGINQAWSPFLVRWKAGGDI